MSDDMFKRDRGEVNEPVADLTSVSRNSTVTGSLDTIFKLLSAARRRYLLYYLLTMDGDIVEFEAAVNAVYKYEAAGDNAGDHSSREEIRIALRHNHLPCLANAGVLDYDLRQGTIRFREPPALEEWVEHARHKELDY